MISSNENKIDMLSGNIVNKMFVYAMPLAFTYILQQLFNACDVIICGKFVGDVALAAVGANSAIINLLITSMTNLSLGANVLIANYIGAEKNHKNKNVVHTSITFAFLLGIVIVFLGLAYAKNLLIITGTPNNVIKPATDYFKILIIGAPFMLLYNFGAAILRSIGDTKRPLIILSSTGVLNVILNIVFVVNFNLGVAGVALATAISNAIASIIVMMLLSNEKSDIKFDMKCLMIDLNALRKILIIGVPSAISGMVFSISNICVQTSVNSLGSETMAANTAALNFEMLPLYLYYGFASAGCTFISQNFGAKNYHRCRRINNITILLGFVSSTIVMLPLVFASRILLHIFTNSEEVINIAMTRIRFVSALSTIQTLYEVCAGSLRALKHPILPAIMTMLGTVLFRIIWCFTVFPCYNTYLSIMLVYPISWIIMDIAMYTTYLIISNKELG